MSYCVNCGVELRDSESHCPLCDTRVVNPNKPFNEHAERAYPKVNDIVLSAEDRMMTVILITVLTFLPALTCLIVDYVISGNCTWSYYVVIAMSVIWTFIVPPLIIKRNTIVISLVIDTVTVLTGLWLVERLVSIKGWFTLLALPIVLSSSLFTLVMVIVAKRIVFGVLKMISFCFGFSALLIIVIEIVTDIYMNDVVQLQWSLIVFIPLVLLSVALIVIDRKRAVKDEMMKKLHI